MVPATVERLSAADASNVVIDAPDQVDAFLLAGVLRPGGWVPTEGDPDLDQLRAVAPVGGTAGLAQVCASPMTRPMDPDRPLWELLVVPGTASDGPGLVLRIHHAVADGVVGVAMLGALLDERTGSDRNDGGAPSDPAARQSPPVPPPRPSRRRGVASLLTGLTRVTAVLRATVPPTALGPIGRHRGVAFAEVDLERLTLAARSRGATVNDALLAAVAVAAKAALTSAGPVPPVLPASVPVTLPDHRGSGNAVGVMLVELPTSEEDRGRRLGCIAERTSAAKADACAQGTLEVTRTRWGARLFARTARHQHFVALFVTNVRGPRDRLSLGGAPLGRAWPVTPLQGNVRLGGGGSALSYAGRLGCTVHVDADVLDTDLLARVLQDELEVLSGG